MVWVGLIQKRCSVFAFNSVTFRVSRMCYLVLLDIKLGLDMITFSSLVFFFSQSIIWLYVRFEFIILPISLVIFLWGVQPERSVAFFSSRRVQFNFCSSFTRSFVYPTLAETVYSSFCVFNVFFAINSGVFN